jgi:CHAD domain-containing protein
MEETYKEIKTGIYQNFELLTRTIDINIIHDVRLNFKKLKALYKMYDFLYDDFDYKEEFEYNKEFYSILGEHRDNEILSIYIKDFTTIEQKDELIENYLKTEYYPIISKYKPIINGGETAYLDYLFNSIDLDTKNHEEIHDQRKIIKDFYYVATWCDKKDEASEMKNLSNLLGEWHDRVLVVDELENMFFPDEFLSKIEQEANMYLNGAKKEYNQLLKTKVYD